ncbi:MAG: hypothetical protein DRQ78_11800 [Epsilonproteobacteria bacterium]|nr:MAG: hypothetical protein DRQ78_11800 [Campylobacterota bacterium]
MCTEVDIDDMGYVLPEKDDKVALIDADTVVFASCAVFAQVDDLLPRDMYSDKEWEEIIAEPGYDKDKHIVRFINYNEAFAHSLDKINSIVDRTGCRDFELHFTRGRKSFPYTMVDKDYKGNRDNNAEPPPFGLAGLKDMFVEKYPKKAFNNYEAEADHIVVCKKRDFPSMYTLCSVDKDVYLALPGKHFNYYSSTKWNIDMKWVTNTEDDAMRRYYVQTLTGDKGDNIIGLHGIGPVKATKALSKCEDEECMWKIVVKMYIDHKRGEIDAITNMRLVNMRQMFLNDEGQYEVKLWKPGTRYDATKA